MKNLSIAIFVLSLAAFSSCKNNVDTKNKVPKLELVWQTDTLLTTCESTLYDNETGIIYVSNINNNPWDIDSNGFISTIDTTGKILELKWFEGGLSGPKGMGIHNGKLYVNDIDRLVEIDIASRKIINNYHVEGKPNLNDITVSEDGVVYSSCSSAKTIYKLKDGKLSPLFMDENLKRLNGLLSQKEGIYYLSSGNGEFGIYNLETNTNKLLANGFGNGDGIVVLENKDFIVSNWKGEIFHVSREDWSKTSLLDTKEQGVYTADIDYIPENNLLLVPTFFSNHVACYRVVK